MKAWVAFIFILLALVLAISPAFAQSAPQCGPYLAVIEGLAARYGEDVVWSELRPDGSQVVITAAEGGSWTVLLVEGDRACIATFGDEASSGPVRPAGEDV